jgi:hypothetical protein
MAFSLDSEVCLEAHVTGGLGWSQARLEAGRLGTEWRQVSSRRRMSHGLEQVSLLDFWL